MAQSKPVFERPCSLCGEQFITRRSLQKRCLSCVREPCEKCGGKKDARAQWCKRCDATNKSDRMRRAVIKGRIEPLPAIPCGDCGDTFIPRNIRVKLCPLCANKPCEQCGKYKGGRTAKLCRRCDSISQIGKPKPSSRRKPLSIEQLSAEIEAFGFLPEKQFSFGYVIGVMFGDGSIWKTKERIKYTHKSDGSQAVSTIDSYAMRLSVKSEAFAERFAREWNKLTGRNIKAWSALRTNFAASTLKGRADGYSLQVFHVAPKHAKIAPYLSHLKYESDPIILLDFPLEVIRGFIHGMIDSEGYVCPEYTDIANKNIKLLDVLVAMFAMLGQKATVYTSRSQEIAHLRTRTMIYKFGVTVDF